MRSSSMAFVVALTVTLMCGCGSKTSGNKGTRMITHGKISGNKYVTADSNVQMVAPDGWEWTIENMQPYEQRVAEKIIRPHELGYLVNAKSGAVIIVESYALTWGGKPLVPTDITFDPEPERMARVCEKIMEAERDKKFTSYRYECLVPRKNGRCQVHAPCLLSWRERISHDGAIIFEKTHMIGKSYSYGAPNNDHGWYINTTAMSTPEDVGNAKSAIDALVRSMSQVP